MRTQRVIAALGLPLAVVGLSACGGTSDAAGTDDEVATLVSDTDVSEGGVTVTDEVASDLSPDEAALELSECLRDEGLDVADIAVDADGNIDLRSAFDSVDPGDASFRDAMEACRDIIADVGFGGGGGRGALFDDPAVQDAFLEFSDCIRDQGFEDVADLAAPTPGQGGAPGDTAGTDTAGTDTADGERPERGQGQRQGDFGDRSAQLAERLELDPEDPEVIAALDECMPILDNALSGLQPGGATDPGA